MEPDNDLQQLQALSPLVFSTTWASRQKVSKSWLVCPLRFSLCLWVSRFGWPCARDLCQGWSHSDGKVNE